MEQWSCPLEDMVIKSTNFSSVYAGKKVLLTGHTGFKGAWLLTWLHELGAIVKGYALSPENDNDLYHLLEGNQLCTSVIADIRDRSKVIEEVNRFQPDFIFHLAAQPLVRLSYEMPVQTFETNVMGTVNVLEAVKQLAIPCSVIIVTTDKVYKNNESGIAYRETDPLGGFDPYSASKAAAEMAVNSYRDSFFNPADIKRHKKGIASARAGNVIGGGDRAKDRIIPDIMRALEKGQNIVVRNPKAIRPWQHVLEPLRGYLLLGAMLKENPRSFANAWNFGPLTDDVLTVKEIVEKSLLAYGKGNYITPPQTDQPYESGLLKLDISQAIDKLNWKPKLTSSQAIQLTIDWYKNVTSETAGLITRKQILHYQEL